MSEKPSLPTEEETLSVEKDSEIIDVQSYDSQTFSVSKDFWMHASPNTKAIFAQLPVQFEKDFKNPCFWQKFEGKRRSKLIILSLFLPLNVLIDQSFSIIVDRRKIFLNSESTNELLFVI